MKLMRQLTWCACKYNFTFSAKHVPGVKNNLADSISRLQIDKFRQLAPQAAKHPHLCPAIFYYQFVLMWHTLQIFTKQRSKPFRKT
jgi:hypothetical protein